MCMHVICVWVDVYKYRRVYTWVYMYVCMHVDMCMYLCTCTCIMYTYVLCMYSMYVCLYGCTYAWMGGWMYGWRDGRMDGCNKTKEIDPNQSTLVIHLSYMNTTIIILSYSRDYKPSQDLRRIVQH